MSTDQEEFDYAIYRKNSVLPIYKQGRSGFESNLSYRNLQDPALFHEGNEIGEIHYFGFTTNDGRVIVIASKAYDYIYIFSNFSFQLFILLAAMFCGMFRQGYLPDASSASASFSRRAPRSTSFTLSISTP
ncbi:MAG: hypothetical protein RLN96_04000, partial [Pseudomonadales bacterium]